MILGKRALAVDRRHDGGLQQVRQFDQLRARLRVQHALARIQQRRLGIEQHLGCFLDVADIAARDRGAHGRIVQRLVAEIRFHHIGGHFDHDRPEPAVLQGAEGAPHHRHGHVRQGHGFDLLGHGSERARRVEHREQLRVLSGMAERQEQHRARIRIGRGDAGKRVLGAGAVLHGEYGGRLAVGRAREPRGHVDADALLPADHGLDAGRHRRLDDRRRRKAKQRRNALALEDLGNGVHHEHGRLPVRFG